MPAEDPLYFITEAGMAWNPILDVPIIPSGAVKGILRNAFYGVTNDGNLTDCLFGSAGSAGMLTIFDAYPTSSDRGLLTADIINPHYRPNVRDEYEVMPVPVKFLAVNPGVTFTTFIAFNQDELNRCNVKAPELLKLLLAAVVFSGKMGWAGGPRGDMGSSRSRSTS
ncbi:type III-B CRISPR module RAMP protein Cmr6 [Acidilobus sp.]|uniref:type III-B CRISPR module RAMP protein Cmr6 n=1 Tax=Acidilobus sp. TaxID=1872109 RepID=UPI003CFC52A5